MSRISAATKFAKQTEILEVCQTAVYNVTKKIASEYEARGNTHYDAVAYSSGYIQSFLASVLADLPKTQREEVLAVLARRAA